MKVDNVLSIHLCCFLFSFCTIIGFKAYSTPIAPPNGITQVPSTCIMMNQVHFIGLEQVKEIARSQVNRWRQKIEGQCIDEQGLLKYADDITAELVHAGYLTSYLYYPEQTFLFGILQAKIIAGTVSSVIYQHEQAEDKSLQHIFPFQLGDALNLRQVEQDLYNLQNASLIPFQVKLIADDKHENATQIIVLGQHRREFQGTLSFESHSMAHQVGNTNTVGHTFMVANPLLLNDFLYSNISRQFSNTEETEVKSAMLFYSLPYQYWLFSILSGYQKNKTVIASNDVVLPLKQHNSFLLLQAEYLLKRTENAMTSLSLGSESQRSDTFLSNLHLQTQQRLAHYIIGELTHQVNFLQGSALIALKYKQGTSWFGANAQQVTGLNKPQVLQVSASAMRVASPFQYESQLDVQLSRDKLDVLLEQESFIGFGGVSGFIGGAESFDMGDNSLKLQSEVLWQSPWSYMALYTSLGLGTTSNDRGTFWKENLLLGGRVGAKGQIGRLSYHLFTETPIWQTDQLLVNSMSTGLQVRFHY
ncbi:ShlB/FhaC/HecB family hemolysin secretion/activation protein [Providencia huaxiensis]|uniref:ShlB/FhaC/HecB family hemolysin secretion/activation protein n=1 Tax=Providencia TaxID=586 RepID=UPI0019D13027|nr:MULTISPECIES: ShlB/FhaC/HecB family hemolysin secretion/activation protein [Providencia]MBN6361192.1 ShlB/FhaC/HecB family hemolysin secretion/activation protein [Providencia huaxiensis]